MPQVQLQGVKQVQIPVQRVQEEDRNPTVTACTGNDAIQDRAHDAGKRLWKSDMLSIRLLSVLLTKQPELGDIIFLASIKQAMEMQAVADRRNRAQILQRRKTSRAKSIWHDEGNKIGTVSVVSSTKSRRTRSTEIEAHKTSQ